MRLYLMRHGIAIDREEPNCPPEPERFLTPEGVQKTREVARGLRALGVDAEVFLTSPFVRAVQTAEIVAEALGFPRDKIQHTGTLKYPMKQAEFFHELARLRAAEVICFGHAPALDESIAYALGARTAITALKKAGVACLEMESLAPTRGALLWLCTPKALRRIEE